MKCSEARRLQPRFFALELAPATEAAVREHLEICGRCRERFGASEPAFALAWKLARTKPGEDAGFVAGVFSGIHQRRFEQRLASRRHRWWAAAAAALLFVVAMVAVRETQRSPVKGAFPVAAVAVAQPEAPLVDLEGSGVRVYELTGSTRDAVRVAFVVDPHTEF